MIRSGTPKREIHDETNARATVSAVPFSKATASGNRVNLSMMLRHWLNPFDDDRVIRSIWMCSNRCEGGSKFPIGEMVWRVILFAWHGMQHLVHLAQSLFIDGHT